LNPLLQLLFGEAANQIRSLDVGSPKMKGSTIYDKKTNSYTLSGGGYNIWFNRDEFQYAYKRLSGDFILTGDFEFIGEGKDPHRKIGWMVRESLTDTAVHISAVYHGDGLTVLQWRLKPGMNMRILKMRYVLLNRRNMK
jgi:hypothetical protein